MRTRTIILKRADVFSNENITSPQDCLIARQRLLDRVQELERLREQLSVEGCAAKWAKLDGKPMFEVPRDTAVRAKLINSPPLLKYSGYHLLGLVGIPLIVAVCLLLQLRNLPNSSLSYSLLNAIVSLLFNFSSSALLKTFSFLVSLLGLSRWIACSDRSFMS